MCCVKCVCIGAGSAAISELPCVEPASLHVWESSLQIYHPIPSAPAPVVINQSMGHRRQLST